MSLIQRYGRAGFTMVEIMFVVALIALLATIAIPAFVKARRRSQNAAFVSDVRIADHAFQQRSLEAGGFPPDANTGVMPDGMADYLANMRWANITPLGGEWDWHPDVDGVGSGVRVVGASADDNRMTEVDVLIDDGDLSTGLFRKLAGSDGYMYIVE